MLSLALITQSFLTFSRGGVYNFAIAMIAALIHFLWKPGQFFRSFVVVLVIGLVVIFVVLPQLELLTAGALSQRFTDFNLSSRENIVRADLQLFIDNPFFGVGPGLAKYYRQGSGLAAAHTEYTRLLAEHGVFGILSLIILVYLLLQSYFKAPDAMTKGWVAAWAVWSMVEMAHSAMRIVAISTLLGMAMLNWQNEEAPENPENAPQRVNSYSSLRKT